MGYYIDLEKISIDEYKNKLKNAYLPPSRMILKESTEEIFSFFKFIGIKNIQELIQTLKNKNKFETFAQLGFLDKEYLTILLRELKSIHPKPNKICDFKCISTETIEELEKIGINDTFKLYDLVITPQQRKKLAKSTNITDEEILKLTKLTDLSRIKWFGVTFATLLYEIGVDTVEKVSKSDYNDLHQKINQTNKELGIFKGSIGLNDTKILIEAAKDLILDIEY